MSSIRTASPRPMGAIRIGDITVAYNTLRENATLLSCGSAGQNMAILNNLVIPLALANLAKTEEALQRICSASLAL